ncbi:hypothetical protein acsn021_06090 [Anaerocolumna cellulosilytica]|uniref:Uncharacterized protein n=1 Tax=Anaerocolumna cellulosilytica TaxID=433286 RepID=A0A6S6R162_9FIRM|nr:DNA and RNA helicase [Anaerocolumna cellulosilytica]MBB5197748.1 hypothetical protein [Anaerocolumna cellulosilytica]BCJ93040.1 hypothetical protein acsn021_06090 [Anaerocolumna cellulosilytica]
MFAEQFPIFEKDKILKADMLTELKDYPKNMFWLQYQDYSDGILCGARVIVTGKELTITPGVIKFKEKLFHMEAEVKVPYTASGTEHILKVRFLEDEIKNDFIICRTELVLEEGTRLEVDEAELCRFTLKDGALLRQDYQDLADFATLHNTVNIIHVKYAGIKEETLSPEITAYFGKELLGLSPDNPYDISFALLCLQEKQMERGAIKAYLMARLNVREDALSTNEQLHRYLTRILDDVVNGRNGRNYQGGGAKRLIVE